MPSPFSIVALTSSPPLDADRRGEASYEVTNISGSPIRGRARVVAEPPTKAAWLKLSGEEERDFTVGSKQTYTIKIGVDAAAAAGDYSFRLDMVGVENPDDLYSRGETISFHVPEPPDEPEPEVRKGYPPTVIGAAIGGLSSATLAVILAAILGGSVFAKIVAALVFGAGPGVGAWVALNLRGFPWPRETALVVAALSLIAALIVIFAIEGTVVLFLFLAGLIVFPLVARVIILVWKTGRP